MKDAPLTREGFKRWISNLYENNEEVLLRWFDRQEAVTFWTAWTHLRDAWTEEEVAKAFMRQ